MSGTPGTLRASSRRAASAAALVVGFLPGCLVVPYPVQPHVAPARIAPYVAPDAPDLSSFLPGRTTRDEVLLRLGEPDRVLGDGRTLIYLGVDQRQGAWVAIYGIPHGEMPEQGPFVALVLSFDERGVLERAEAPHEDQLTISSTRFFERLESGR